MPVRMAQKMLTFLKDFDAYDDDSVVPNDSIIREFIGGSTYADPDPLTGKKGFVGSNYLIRNVANYLRDKHDELREKHEEFRESMSEKHEGLVDSIEESAEDRVESIKKGESLFRAK